MSKTLGLETTRWQDFFQSADALLPSPLSSEQQQQFKALYERLVSANQTTNLTRITSLDDFCARHLLDALTLIPFLPALPKPFSLLDLGSGAGFPALPLAILYPENAITAVESTQKKAAFITETAEAFSLTQLKVLPERAETLGQDAWYREQFDVVTVRAVAAMAVIAELGLPFLKVGGKLIAMKTPNALEAELTEAEVAIQRLGAKLVATPDVSLPNLPNRVLIILEKRKPTPPLYPRSPGLPAKSPLLK